MSLVLPQKIGKFLLTEQIGNGSTGCVYHAFDTFSGQSVAMKLMERDVEHDPEFSETCREQFQNEASLAGKLVHPHIVSILEALITDDFGYIVMEYVPADNLSRYTVPDHLLPIDSVLQIIFKCCGALDYASRCGVIHRDIKPANIMLMSDTNVKIADFGAAVLYDAQITQKVTVGTPFYMSPEQMGGHRLSHLSDMYSLGVVAYELLTGSRPFHAYTVMELFEAVTYEEPIAPSARRVGGLPPEIDRIVLRMIEKDPADRYQTWAELALDIANIGKFSQLQQEISDSEKFGLLREAETLKEFSDAEIWELIQASSWSRLPARTTVLQEGDHGDSMYFLAQGQLKVMKQERLLNLINAGEYFGEMAYVHRGTTRQASIESMSNIVIAEFPFAALEKLSANCELRFAKALLHSMTDRLMLAGDRIARMHA